MQLQGLLDKFGLSGHLTIERSGSSLFVRNGSNPNEIRTDLADQFQLLRAHLNSRKQFHCLVIDDSYSHQEASCFVFNRGLLIKAGRLDVDAVYSDLHLEDLDDYSPPLAINDQIIAFIKKHKKRYRIQPMQ